MGAARLDVLGAVATRERRGWRRSTESDIAEAIADGARSVEVIREELDRAERDGLLRAVGRDYAGEPRYVLTDEGDSWLAEHDWGASDDVPA